MLLIKLGILGILGKKMYSGFLIANLITHTTHTLKMKMRKDVSKCSLQQD